MREKVDEARKLQLMVVVVVVVALHGDHGFDEEVRLSRNILGTLERD